MLHIFAVVLHCIAVFLLSNYIDYFTSNSGCFFRAFAMLFDASAPIVLPSNLKEWTVLALLIAFTISAAAKMN